MKIIPRIIFSFFSNFVAFELALYFVKGFEITGGLPTLLIVVFIFTLINLIAVPILKFILRPFIFLTLGLGVIVINAAALYALDYILDSVTINGLVALLYATLIIGFVNLILSFAGKRLFKQ